MTRIEAIRALREVVMVETDGHELEQMVKLTEEDEEEANRDANVWSSGD